MFFGVFCLFVSFFFLEITVSLSARIVESKFL